MVDVIEGATWAWQWRGGALCAVVAGRAVLAACRAGQCLILAGLAVATRRLTLYWVERARRTQRLCVRAYRAVRALGADNAIVLARHHCQRHVLMRTTWARQWRGGALCAVVSGRAVLAARRASLALKFSKLTQLTHFCCVG